LQSARPQEALAMFKLAQFNKVKVIDALAERLAFERASVQLYDAIIGRVRRAKDPELTSLLPDLEAHREHEREHQEWLERKIRELGGDPNLETEYSRLAKVESQGIEKVILDGDDSIPHMFHALLTAELTDNAGWEMLVDLADEVGDHDARHIFRRYLHDEEHHLKLAMRAFEAFRRAEILGEKPRMPKAC
jgi:bacterioferritin (cytochrome b1)